MESSNLTLTFVLTNVLEINILNITTLISFKFKFTFKFKALFSFWFYLRNTRVHYMVLLVFLPSQIHSYKNILIEFYSKK